MLASTGDHCPASNGRLETTSSAPPRFCASDPYAVLGVMSAYHMKHPDLVAGVATSTSAGVEVVEKLSGAKALDMLDRASLPELRELLADALA